MLVPCIRYCCVHGKTSKTLTPSQLVNLHACRGPGCPTVESVATDNIGTWNSVKWPQLTGCQQEPVSIVKGYERLLGLVTNYKSGTCLRWWVWVCECKHSWYILVTWLLGLLAGYVWIVVSAPKNCRWEDHFIIHIQRCLHQPLSAS